MRSYITIVAVAIGLVPVVVQAQTKRSNTAGDVPFKVLDSRPSSPGELGAVRLVVTSRERFEAYWRQSWKSTDSAAVPPLPLVDFTKNMVIIVGLGPQPGINAGIEITRVQDRDGVLDISVNIPRRRGCVTTLTVIEPLQMIQVRAMMSIAVFHDRITPSRC